MRASSILTVVGVFAACSAPDGGTVGFVGSVASEAMNASSGASSGTELAGEGPGSSSDASTSVDAVMSTGEGAGLRLDMGLPDFGSSKPAGCEGRIDFLFVISAAGTMDSSQVKLLASFPDFIETIEQQFAGFDAHILVANPNTAPGWLMGDCSLCQGDCDPDAAPPTCGAVLQPCDKKIGAGITYPAGANASNHRCTLAEDRRYMVSGDPDIQETFACVAQVGTAGGGTTAEAMVAAIQPGFNDPDEEYACNRGFLRDDALLVVTIIQDSYDENSAGSPDKWIAALRAAKHDDDDAFAVLVLTTDIDVGHEHLCHPNDFTNVKNRLRLLADGVEHGFIESICMESFGGFFADKVEYLVDLCDDFVPPG